MSILIKDTTKEERLKIVLKPSAWMPVDVKTMTKAWSTISILTISKVRKRLHRLIVNVVKN